MMTTMSCVMAMEAMKSWEAREFEATAAFSTTKWVGECINIDGNIQQ